MGCTSSDTVQSIIRRHKDKIEEAKKNIKELLENGKENCISIIFKLMNGKTYSIICFNSTPLFHVFLLLVDKAKDSYYSKLDKLKIYYNTVDISQYFTQDNGKDVSSLNFAISNPIIYINV